MPTLPKPNARNRMDALALLGGIRGQPVALAFFDPQYRSVLDHQKYGNEGARQKGRAALPVMRERTIREVVGEIESVLRPSGHLCLWVDKFLMGEGTWRAWLPNGCGLKLVDFAGWDKIEIGMGKRFRCVSEYLLLLQKPPIRAKGVWTDHKIRDCWPEPKARSIHAHAKPLEFTKRIICAATRPGDLVVDPAAGGYVVLRACAATGRKFLGCDLI